MAALSATCLASPEVPMLPVRGRAMLYRLTLKQNPKGSKYTDGRVP